MGQGVVIHAREETLLILLLLPVNQKVISHILLEKKLKFIYFINQR
ncbi:unnamed protein product [Spirodela intermedia]|uniref:Uncharacterized protein n=1 Tax=Spirodela intermedia TaxID=51605 RepID=A0ABN7EAM3_SPIIN|nr:unnamed protein product [Spirodela intermedia]